MWLCVLGVVCEAGPEIFQYSRAQKRRIAKTEHTHSTHSAATEITDTDTRNQGWEGREKKCAFCSCVCVCLWKPESCGVSVRGGGRAVSKSCDGLGLKKGSSRLHYSSSSYLLERQTQTHINTYTHMIDRRRSARRGRGGWREGVSPATQGRGHACLLLLASA